MDKLKTAIREKGIAVEELRQYSYDTNRNQTDIKNTKTGENQTYVYDAENRLSQVSVTKDRKTAVIQQNSYNGEGQRIQKVDVDETINYYYQDGVVAYTTDANGKQNSQNLIGTDGNVLATERFQQNATQYYLYNKDIQGSTSSLVKEDGRFLTEDTYHGENDKPDTQHLYVYCANNPVNYVDPSGHYAVALYTLVKIVAGGVVFYVSYSTWKRRRIKTRYAGKRVTFKTKISVWLTWRTFNRIMYSKSKSKSNTKNKGESKKSKKERSTNAPEWSKYKKQKKGESKKQYATRILNEKYGKGNWRKGPESEYSRIIKYHRK